jgi:hypothetical protein
MGVGDQLTLGQAARAAGGWAWAEEALYGVVGRWARRSRPPRAKLYLDAASQHHAWRAELWRQELGGRLVQAYGGPGPGPAEVVRPFSPASQALVDALSALEDDLGAVAAYQRVALARAVHEYRRWQGRLSPAPDGPLYRAIGFALADTMADWAEGAGALAELLGEGAADGAAKAAAACARADLAVAGAEVVFGG